MSNKVDREDSPHMNFGNGVRFFVRMVLAGCFLFGLGYAFEHRASFSFWWWPAGVYCLGILVAATGNQKPLGGDSGLGILAGAMSTIPLVIAILVAIGMIIGHFV